MWEYIEYILGIALFFFGFAVWDKIARAWRFIKHRSWERFVERERAKLRAEIAVHQAELNAQRKIMDGVMQVLPEAWEECKRLYVELQAEPDEREKNRGRAVRVYSSLRPLHLEKKREEFEKLCKDVEAMEGQIFSALVRYNRAAIAHNNAAYKLYWDRDDAGERERVATMNTPWIRPMGVTPRGQ